MLSLEILTERIKFRSKIVLIVYFTTIEWLTKALRAHESEHRVRNINTTRTITITRSISTHWKDIPCHNDLNMIVIV